MRGRSAQAEKRSRKRTRHPNSPAATAAVVVGRSVLQQEEQEEEEEEFQKVERDDRCAASVNSKGPRRIMVEVRWLFDREDIESHAWWQGGVSVSSRDLPQQAWELADSDKVRFTTSTRAATKKRQEKRKSTLPRGKKRIKINDRGGKQTEKE